MNVIDKYYYKMLNSASSKTKIITGFLFLAIGALGLLASFMEPTKNFTFDNIRSIGFLIFGISLLLSSVLILSTWEIDNDRFPIGIRKLLIILFQVFGFLFIIIGYIRIFFF